VIKHSPFPIFSGMIIGEIADIGVAVIGEWNLIESTWHLIILVCRS